MINKKHNNVQLPYCIRQDKQLKDDKAKMQRLGNLLNKLSERVYTRAFWDTCKIMAILLGFIIAIIQGYK
jgi:hypothetical protein